MQKAGFVTLEAQAAPDAVLALVRGAAIEGVVSDGSGDPIMNVVVAALQPPAGAQPTLAAETRTDDLGRYRLHSLAAGDYIIRAATDRTFLLNMALMPGQKMPETTSAFYPAATSLENAKAVRLISGREASGIDVTLTPNPPIVDPAGKPTRPPEEPKGTGRVVGRITDATSGKPIKGAHLLLLPMDGLQIVNWSSTDADGRYEYSGLAPRKYTLHAEAAAHVTLEYGRARAGEVGVPIDVADGQRVLADMALPRTPAIEGILTDEFGDPAAGVVVQVSRRQYVAGRHRLMPVTGRYQPLPTDDKGHYRATGLEQGEYYVAALTGVFANENGIGGFAPTFYPGTIDSGAAVPVLVSSAADNPAVSFALVPTPTLQVTGTMVGPDGAPVGRGMVMLMPPDRLKRPDFNLARGSTSPDGTFVLRNVPQGTYTIQGYAPPPAGYRGPGNLNAMPFGWTSVIVGDADVDGVVLKVSNGTMLRGTITLEEGSGPPLGAQQVHVMPIPVEFDSAPVGGGPLPSETHDDWTFEVSHLSGRQRIFVNIASPAWMLKKIAHEGIDVTDEALDFREKDATGVEIVLTPKTTRVSGAVSDDKGPVSDYAVVIFSSDPTKWIDRSRFVAMGRSGQEGRYQIGKLPPDDYLAIALPNVTGTEWMDPDFLQALRPLATTFSLHEGESKTLELKLKRKP